MQKVLLLTVVLLMTSMVYVSGIAGAQGDITISIDEEINSGVHGTAILTEKGNQTEVVVKMNKQADGTKPMPVHIHTGVCNANPQVTYPLQPIVNGTSTTMVNAPLSEIRSTLRSIQVHRSAEEINVWIACGNLQPLSELPKTGNTPLYILIALLTSVALIRLGTYLHGRAA